MVSSVVARQITVGMDLQMEIKMMVRAQEELEERNEPSWPSVVPSRLFPHGEHILLFAELAPSLLPIAPVFSFFCSLLIYFNLF